MRVNGVHQNAVKTAVHKVTEETSAYTFEDRSYIAPKKMKQDTQSHIFIITQQQHTKLHDTIPKDILR